MEGTAVGLLDGDIYGPTMPIMLGIDQPPKSVNNRMIPQESAGIRFMSMGLLVKSDQPLDLARPNGASRPAAVPVRCGVGRSGLPHRRSSARYRRHSLTLAQQVPLTGAVIVSTPQDVGLRISMKTLRMFQQTRVPILGIVENMSYYICPHCNSRDHIFGEGGARRAAAELEIPFLGEVPLDLAIRQQSDAGSPIVVAQPESESAKTLREISRKVAAQVSIRAFSTLPVLEVE